MKRGRHIESRFTPDPFGIAALHEAANDDDDPYKERFARTESNRAQLAQDVGIAAAHTSVFVASFSICKPIAKATIEAFRSEDPNPGRVLGVAALVALASATSGASHLINKKFANNDSEQLREVQFPEVGTKRYAMLQEALPKIHIPEGETLASVLNAASAEIRRVSRNDKYKLGGYFGGRYTTAERKQRDRFNLTEEFSEEDSAIDNPRVALLTLTYLAQEVISWIHDLDRHERWAEEDLLYHGIDHNLRHEKMVKSTHGFCRLLDKLLPFDDSEEFSGWQHYAAVVSRREQVKGLINAEAARLLEMSEAPQAAA